MRAQQILLIALLVLGGAIWVGTVGLAVHITLKQRAAEATPRAQAAKVVSVCSKETQRDPCYERVVPELYPKYPVSFVFDVIREIRGMDSQYQFCHVLAHKLGDRVVKEKPDAWMQAMPLNPSDGMCSNGFVHGVINGRFRADVLDEDALEASIPDFTRACAPHDDWKPTTLDTSICVHGMGHLYVFITDAHIRKALSLCERTSVVAGGDYGFMCRDGVFMQIFQPLEPDDFLMLEQMPVRPSTTTVREFCGMFSDDSRYEGSCLRESWPFYRESLRSGEGVAAFCADQPNEEEEYNCFRSAAVLIGRQTLSESSTGEKICSQFPDEYQGMCLQYVAIAHIEEDRNAWSEAIRICSSAPRESDTHDCLTILAGRSSYFFGEGTPRQQAFCAALPETYRTTCIRS